MPTPTDSPPTIATIRIQLIGSEPAVWRRVEVENATTLDALHDVIQRAMGWEDAHLWMYRIGRDWYEQNTGDRLGGDRTRDAARTSLAKLVMGKRRATLVYVYDMGDSWEHEITISHVRRGEPEVAYPRLMDGAGACPPEDSGGLWGFYAALEALGDPTHPEHEDATEWLGGYDPAAFDLSERQRAVALLAAAPRRRQPREEEG